jgi:hypothetical protein
MLFKEIIAVCSENPTKIIAVYTESYTKSINKLWAKCRFREC